MNFGDQLIAPQGYQCLMSDQAYYFAGFRSERALLVWFVPVRHGWRVYTMHMARADFDSARKTDPPLIQNGAVQHRVPPWLWPEEGINYDELEERRYKERKESYRAQAERRLARITPALQLAEQILGNSKPLKAVVRVCSKAGIKEHPHRLQLWFFAKILHLGAGIWALKRPTGQCGGWDRTDNGHADVKYGRPALDDPKSGYSSATIRDQIMRSYASRCGLGRTMSSIHRDALREDFGCVTVLDRAGNEITVHPHNRPFPSYGQFRAVVVSNLGLDQVRHNLFGEARIRNRRGYDQGSYNSQYANLLEDVQIDAYFVADRPRSLYSNDPMPRLAVVRAKCSHSAANVGVGFALEGESEEAYRAALFCAAVPKELICRLYGLDADLVRWDMQGLPPACLSDRGPAGTSVLVMDLAERFPLKAVAPSNTPKSKASVEAGNPRDIELEGAPTYVQSDLTIPQLIKREVTEAVLKNHQTDICERLTNEEVCEFRRRGWAANPQNLWRFRSEQMRTDARQISIEQAVRRFLTPIKVPVDRRGVNFRTHWYSSKAFRDAKVQERLSSNPDLELTAYAISMALTLIWVEVDGRLMELTPHRITRVGQEEFAVCVFEAEAIQRARAALGSATRQVAEAAELGAAIAFEASTGKGWSDGRRKPGRPKPPTGATRQEAKITKGRVGSKSSRRAA